MQRENILAPSSAMATVSECLTSIAMPEEFILEYTQINALEKVVRSMLLGLLLK